MELRAYQVEAIEKVLDYAVAHPQGRLLLVCPPGGGKTVMVATILRIMATENGLRGLVVAHRRELINQHYEHLLKCDVPKELVGVVMGQDPRTNSGAPLQVGSIDTLNRRCKPAAHILATDEAHRDASDSRRRLRSLYPNAFRLGATATPYRLDGRGLQADFDEMLVVATVSELIADKFLVAPKAYTVPEELLPDLRKVRTQAGEFEPSGLEQAVNRKALVGSIVEHWVRMANQRATVVFATSIEHSKHIIARFVEAGVSAEHLDKATPDARRAQILKDLEAGRTKVISCVNVLAEGWDCPPCKCVIQARPTKSLNLHIQQAGRVMRPWGSETPLLLDHAGNTLLHGLPQMERDWSLEQGVRNASKKPPAKVCGKCFAIVPSASRVCPECGEAFTEGVSGVPEELEGILTEYQLTQEEKDSEWDHILKFAQRKNFPESWAKQAFQAKYGPNSIL